MFGKLTDGVSGGAGELPRIGAASHGELIAWAELTDGFVDEALRIESAWIAQVDVGKSKGLVAPIQFRRNGAGHHRASMHHRGLPAQFRNRYPRRCARDLVAHQPIHPAGTRKSRVIRSVESSQRQRLSGSRHGHVEQSAPRVRVFAVAGGLPIAVKNNDVIKLKAFGAMGGEEQQPFLASPQTPP